MAGPTSKIFDFSVWFVLCVIILLPCLISLHETNLYKSVNSGTIVKKTDLYSRYGNEHKFVITIQGVDNNGKIRHIDIEVAEITYNAYNIGNIYVR